MIDQANILQDKSLSQLKGTVTFILMTSTSHLQQFPDESFDMVISKETLLHIPEIAKEPFFSEIYRVLKPEGKIVLMDWMHNTNYYSKNTLAMMTIDEVAYHLIKPAEYLTKLQKVGFKDIKYENTSLDSYEQSKSNVNTLKRLEIAITNKYDKNTFLESLNSWKWQMEAFKS